MAEPQKNLHPNLVDPETASRRGLRLPAPASRFLETILAALESLEVPDERTHRESYG